MLVYIFINFFVFILWPSNFESWFRPCWEYLIIFYSKTSGLIDNLIILAYFFLPKKKKKKKGKEEREREKKEQYNSRMVVVVQTREGLYLIPPGSLTTGFLHTYIYFNYNTSNLPFYY